MTSDRLSRCGSAFDRRLLQAGRSESPVDGAEQRAMRALGAATEGGGSASHGWRDYGLRAAIGKAAVAVVLTALGAAAIHALERGKGSPVPGTPSASGRPTAIVAASAMDVSTAARTVVEHPMQPTESAGTTEAPKSSKALATHRHPSSGKAPASPSALTVEVALVQQAAQALARGDGEEALRALDQYVARCPRRILGQEAALLRVRALAEVGRTAEAEVR